MPEQENPPVQGGVEVTETAELVGEPREPKRKLEPSLKTFLAILAGLLILGAVVGIVILNLPDAVEEKQGVATTKAATPTTATTTDPEPMNPKGVQSWQEWLETATPAQWDALLKLPGVTREQVQKWAADEQVFGKSFQTELKPGTKLTNTGTRGNTWYAVNNYSVRPGDTLFLETDAGKVVVKVSCGNPVTVTAPQKTKRRQPPPPPTKSARNPYGPPQQPGNPTYGNPAPNPVHTPGYTPGNAETVWNNQQSQPAGGTDPTPVGTPGTGSGGTPGGTTTGGGVTEVTPPPTTAPDSGLAGETASGPAPQVD